MMSFLINNFFCNKKYFYNKTSYKMINISDKNISYRRACVVGSIYVGKEVFYLIKNKKIEKGDPLLLAEIAGINAAKNTSNLLLLCHQVNIENVFLNLVMDESRYIINIYCIVLAYAKTGVEMEGMCGVSLGLLTIYDLTKKLNPFILIKDIKLLFKDGGENGLVLGSIKDVPLHLKRFFFDEKLSLVDIKMVLVTVSDRASIGRYKDVSGQILLDYSCLKKAKVLDYIIIPDEKHILTNILKKKVNYFLPNLVVITGGTGPYKRDITSDVLLSLCGKIIPGIGEMLRVNGSNFSSLSCLSYSIAGVYKKSLIISLPGNPSAVYESLSILQNIFIHSINIINKL